MKDFLKGKIVTTIVVIATFILAGVAIFTAIRLYQLRKQAVSPTSPESIPEATGPKTIACELLTFNLTQETPTPTPTGALNPSATPTNTPTPTNTTTPTDGPTPTDKPGPTNTPGPTSTSSLTPTTPQGATNTPTSHIAQVSPTPGGENLPAAGISLPTWAGLTLGFLIILAAFVFSI